jgi:hypothetical protein
MRLAVTIVLLTVLAACGSSSDTADKGGDAGTAETSAAGTGGLDAACADLGRTWVAAAEGLESSLTSVEMDAVEFATDAMRAATDQMSTEQCEGDIVTESLSGNVQADLAKGDADRVADAIRAASRQDPGSWRSEVSYPGR